MQEKSDEVIHSYTRQQVIEDGMLVDVSSTPEAKEDGVQCIPLSDPRSVQPCRGSRRS